MIIDRPKKGEYHPFYQKYIDQIDAEDALHYLRVQEKKALDFLKAIPEEKSGFAYADGKWQLREVLGHMIDTERVMAFRALSIARNEKGMLPGFDENDYVAHANFKERSLADLIHEFSTVRKATISLLENMGEIALDRVGQANDATLSFKGVVWIIIGHLEHHLSIIKERYL